MDNMNVPFVAYESTISRFERINKRLWIALILLAVLLVGTNIAWLVYESQFEEYEETTITQEADIGDGNLIQNGTGEITINGESKTNNND